MAFTYGIIKGEQRLLKYCKMRWKDVPQFIESFAHNLFDGYIERIWEKDPTDDHYVEYYIMAMKSSDGMYYDPYIIRKQAHESIRTGRYTTVKGS